MIRMAIDSDIEAILDHCAEFWQHTQYDEQFDREHCRIMVNFCHDNDFLAVVEIDGKVVGFSAAVCAPLMGCDVLYGTELAWWIAPDHRGGRNGVALLQFMEQLAKDKGIKYWNMVAMMSSMPDEVCGLYERMGYIKSEVCYTKVI